MTYYQSSGLDLQCVQALRNLQCVGHPRQIMCVTDVSKYKYNDFLRFYFVKCKTANFNHWSRPQMMPRDFCRFLTSPSKKARHPPTHFPVTFLSCFSFTFWCFLCDVTLLNNTPPPLQKKKSSEIVANMWLPQCAWRYLWTTPNYNRVQRARDDCARHPPDIYTKGAHLISALILKDGYKIWRDKQ